MRVLVCGGRDFFDYTAVKLVLDELRPACVIAGEASGADASARRWARETDTQYEGYPANWKQFGKAAGYRRNATMLAQGKPDLVVAFPGGRGTADMIRQAEKAGVKVVRHG